MSLDQTYLTFEHHKNIYHIVVLGKEDGPEDITLCNRSLSARNKKSIYYSLEFTHQYHDVPPSNFRLCSRCKIVSNDEG